MRVFADVDIAQRKRASGERNGNRAKAVIVILDKAGQVIGDAVFEASAHGPAAARFGRGRQHEEPLDKVFVALPGAAGLRIAEQAITGVADEASHRAQRSSPQPDDEWIKMEAHVMRPVKVCLGTEYPAGDLIVAAALDTGEE